MNNTTIRLTVEELNAEERRLYMLWIILVCTPLACVGVIGNILVLFIYVFKFKPSNHRIFIVSLAVIDLIACNMVMPLVVYSFLHLFTYFNSVMCKLLTVFNYFICISSSAVLIVIAIDRCRKMCVPHGKQMTKRFLR